MATFTEKEVVRMAAQIVAGSAANPAASVGTSSFETQAAMESAIEGIQNALTIRNHTITNDPLQIAVIEAAHKH
jgi:hypothetical protein